MIAIVCGGSIGGLITAHALLRAGCQVTVYEQAASIVPAGAGLGLDQTSADTLGFLGLREEFERQSLPMPTEYNNSVRDCSNTTLFRNPELGYRSTHWSLIHKLLLDALPEGGKGLVNFAHRVINIEQAPGTDHVKATVSKTMQDGQQEEFDTEADIFVAADGSMSRTRAKFRPQEARRYAGYCAWRGIMQTSENPALVAQLREAYPELGKAMYFDICKHGHAVLYEVPGRVNWMWYENQPEPVLRGNSVTYQPSTQQLADMRARADTTWHPALSTLMRETSAPFVNAIFDREPLDRFVYGRIVLLGEAAHPTTPHAGRSCNMAVSDAACLGQAISEHPGDIDAALQQYNCIRVPLTKRALMFSRWLGQLKQGFLHEGNNYVWQDGHEVDEILQKTPQLNAYHFRPEDHKFAEVCC